MTPLGIIWITWHSVIYPSLISDSKSKGIAFLLPQSKCFKIIQFRIILEGRIACLEINSDDTVISVFNVYFTTKDKQADQLTAISKLEIDLTNNSPEALIIGGDLNLYVNPLLDKYKGKETDLSQACKLLKNLLNEYNLIDIWSTKNPIAIVIPGAGIIL